MARPHMTLLPIRTLSLDELNLLVRQLQSHLADLNNTITELEQEDTRTLERFNQLSPLVGTTDVPTSFRITGPPSDTPAALNLLAGAVRRLQGAA
jgi:hypothetical protein